MNPSSRRPRPRPEDAPTLPPPLHAAARGGRQVQPHDLAVPRHARRDRPRARVGGRGGDLLPLGRAVRAGGFQLKGEDPLTEHYSCSARRSTWTRRRAASGRGTWRCSRCCCASTPSSSPARRRATAWPGRSRTCSRSTVRDRRPRGEGLSARGLHRRPSSSRACRLHRRGRRGVRALRRGGHARRPLDRCRWRVAWPVVGEALRRQPT